MEIWNFCYYYKKLLEISKFTIEELHETFEATEETKGFLFGILIQVFIQSYIKDIKEFSEKEIYSTPAILVLELVDDLPKFPLEAISLIFGIERYKNYIPKSTLIILNDCLMKSNMVTIYELSYEEKKELLLSMIRGLFVTTKLKQEIDKPILHHKLLQKEKTSLVKEIFLIHGTKPTSPEENEVLSKKESEVKKICKELTKGPEQLTRYLGKDAEDKEYWIFAGDKNRIYVKESSNEEKWRTYSKTKQFIELLQSLIDKGIEEKKLKVILQSVFNDILPLDLPTTKMYYSCYINRKEKGLNNREKAERKKKVITEFQNSNMSLIKIQASTLSMEENYWNFFTQRNIYWCNKKLHNTWVNVLQNIRGRKEYGILP